VARTTAGFVPISTALLPQVVAELLVVWELLSLLVSLLGFLLCYEVGSCDLALSEQLMTQKRFVTGVLYFGYMIIFSYVFFLVTGTIGFLASYWFMRKIYSSVKVP
jgi:hypothetical protein